MRPGEPWGEPTTADPALEVRGNDADLAGVIPTEAPPPLVAFTPVDSDLARAIGLGAGRVPGSGATRLAVPVDVMTLTGEGPVPPYAVNALVAGVRPTRLRSWHRTRPVAVTVDGRSLYCGPATTVVVANGQFLDGADLVPRGHPGDGRLEVQVYALRAGERGPMRRRLPSGSHLPHPRIITATGRQIEIRWNRPVPVEADGRPVPATARVGVGVRPGAIRILI